MLSESQKNYIDLVLMGGEISESELKEYLKSSGWQESEITSGVLYYSSKNKPAETASTIATTSSNKSTSDPYKESPSILEKREEVVSPEFSRFSSTSQAINIPKVEQTQNNIVSKSTPKTAMDGISPIITMPAGSNNPKEAVTGVLKIITWFLFVVLVLMIAALIGYMYYSGTGIFGNVTYSKTNS